MPLGRPDDGQDDPWADQPNGGPNDSSLTQARRNFEKTYSVWGWEEQGDFSAENRNRIFSPAARKEKEELCKLYDSLMTTSDLDQIRKIWGNIRFRWRIRP